ncbi:hypothetical protein B0H17DRAFT_1133872 [Mycena rosella]|uniref:Uncharacterized protein n=1 Tax=Mycena rosella TaxID=1033263 RepID=A0AAD7DJ10_MYCRO|nr:hypothetical protein B0H17DRAFT_1133872 [Mycena rosella]
MSSHTDNPWDRLMTMPPPSLAELASDFEGYSFDTSGWGEDQEIEVTSLPPHMEAQVAAATRALAAPPAPALPCLDLSSFSTPKRQQSTLDISRITPALNLPNLNSFPPFPVIDADQQNASLPYVPDVLRASQVAAASGRYASDVAANRSFGGFVGNVEASERPPTIVEKPQRKRGRSKKDKENEETGASKGYTGEELITLARVVIDADPFMRPHGQKGGAWQEITETLRQRNFRPTSISAASVQHKVEALVAYKKDPAGKHKNLANVIGEGTAASITIGALLERLETQFDAAKDKSDDAKVKIKKKNDEDREGGEAIRQASMRTLRKRARSPDSSDSDVTDAELLGFSVLRALCCFEPAAAPAACAATASPARTAAASPIVVEDDETDDDKDKDSSKKPKSKRRRRLDRRSGSSTDANGLLALMNKENARRAEHDARVAKSLETFVSDSRQQKMEFTSLLKELVAGERKTEANKE